MRKWGHIALFACLALALAGQDISLPDRPADEGIFAPFVSRIRVGVRKQTIVITWEDSADIEGNCVIYRHSKPITKETYPMAREIGTCPSTNGRFEDSPGEAGEYYYAVLLKSLDGSLYEVFVPFKNSTAVSIGPDMTPKKPAIAAEAVDRIKDLTARVDKDSVIISYKAPALGHRLVLYRGSEAIRDSNGILSASIVSILDDGKNEVLDYPVPGIDYYYALIDENDLKTGELRLAPGVNATTAPVSIAAGNFRIGLPSISPLSRTLPLPYFVFNSSIGSGERLGKPLDIPKTRAISPETEKAIDAILAGLSEERFDVPMATVLETERRSPGSGEDYTLNAIVKDTILRKQWAEAILKLEKFLSLHRSMDTEIRSRFYLGQAYAMTGSYRNALFSFLIAQDNHYPECKPWIEYCLRTIRAQ